MASHFNSVHIHFVFSTLNRQKLISPEIRHDLWAYMAGIASNNNMKALEIGGVSEHVHLLISMPSTLTIAKAVQLIKGNSSKWIHEEYKDMSRFAWQVGYASISVSPDRVVKTLQYIRNQEAHHRKISFREEYLRFIKEAGIPYDDRFIWG